MSLFVKVYDEQIGSYDVFCSAEPNNLMEGGENEIQSTITEL